MAPHLSPSALRGPSRRARRLRRVLRRCLSAALMAVAVLGCVHLLRPSPPPGQVAVVVAARDLPAGAVLDAADLRTARWPAGLLPPAHTATVASMVGRELSAPVAQGEPLSDRRVLGPGLLSGTEPGTAAVFVPVASSAALTGVDAGSHVELRTPGSSDVLVTDAPVLAVIGLSHKGIGDTTGDTPGALVALDPVDAGRVASALGARPGESGAMLLHLVAH